MSTPKTSDIVFFIGAGASASFGIPTMKQLVVDFEKALSETGTSDEITKYADIKKTLEKRLDKPVDLEAVFTVINGILDFRLEKLGFLSLYCATDFRELDPDDLETYNTLKAKFQSFIKEKCSIQTSALELTASVYQDFFNRFALELDNGHNKVGNFACHDGWAIFTTNYDTCLEYYWRHVAGTEIDTGFVYDKVKKRNVLQAQKYLQENVGIQLFKLHGSVDWLITKETGAITEQEITGGRSHMGTEFAGELMLYPIAEKELYLNPFISMLLRLNRELERKSVWIVIGYSFNDPVIREIFLKKSDKRKKLILVHKHADVIAKERLCGFQGKIIPMKREFGLKGKYWFVNYSIIRKLKIGPSKFWKGKVRTWDT